MIENGLWGKGSSPFGALVFLCLVPFMPAIFLVVGLFVLTFLYEKYWWVGLAGYVLGLLLYSLGGGVSEAYISYFQDLFFGVSLGSLEGLGGMARELLAVWKKNLGFVFLHGFIVGGLVSMMYFFVNFDIRDLRYRQKMALLRSFGLGKKIEKDKIKRVKTGGKHPENGTLLGYEKKKEVVITDYEANGHTLILGATGAGKTTTIMNFVESAATRGLPVVLVDAKGDPDFIQKTKLLAERHKRPFKVFSTRPEASMKYDPLRYGSAVELTDKIISASDWSEPHYLFQAQRYLQIAFSILLAAKKRPNMANLAESVSIESLSAAIRSMDDANSEKAERLIQGIEDDGVPGGLYNRLAIWGENEISHLFKSDFEEEIDIASAVENGEIIVFSLDSLRYPVYAKMLGRLITIDLKTVVSRSYEGSKKVYVVLDEFGSFANEHISDFINKSRGAGFHIIISTQEVVDLDMAVPGLSNLILGNTNIKIIHRQDVPQSAELLSSVIGTFEDVALTHRLTEKEKAGTLTGTRAYLIHPDEIKRLRTGEAFVSVKNPKFRVQKTNIRMVEMGGGGKNGNSFFDFSSVPHGRELLRYFRRD